MYFHMGKKGIPIVPISVNLSATQLKNEDLVIKYTDIVKQNEVNPNFIQLEITENALIENADTALNIMKKFKKQGFNIALDDFGTGHSSLTCVNLYPIDILKIDRSFIIDSIKYKKSRAIIETIMYMAKELDLQVIAEGVEIEEQYQLIKDLECELIQGYFFSKPKVIDTFEEMLVMNKQFPIANLLIK